MKTYDDVSASREERERKKASKDLLQSVQGKNNEFLGLSKASTMHSMAIATLKKVVEIMTNMNRDKVLLF